MTSDLNEKSAVKEIAGDGEIRQSNSRRSVDIFDAVVVLVAFYGLHQRLKIGPLTYDDSYISFRYALNLAHGNGLVYNLGQHVFGASCPLWIFALALMAKFGAHLPTAAFHLSCALDAATTFLLSRLVRRLSQHPIGGLFAATVFSLGPQGILSSVSGMETSLYIFLIVATFAALAEDLTTAATVLASLVCLTRPEGVLIVPALLVSLPKSKNISSLLVSLSIALLPLIIWCIFSTTYFGSPIPLSVSAKRYSVSHNQHFYDDAVLMLQYMSDPHIIPGQPLAFNPIMPIFLVLIVIGFIACLRAGGAGRCIAVWWLLFFGSWAAVDRYMFYWYYVPLIIAAYTFVGVGATLTAYSIPWLRGKYQLIIEPESNAKTFKANLRLEAFVVAIAGLLVLHSVHPFIDNYVSGQRFEIVNREDLYSKYAVWINQHIGPNAAVCIEEIGAFGYAHPGDIIDLGALVTPGVGDMYRGRTVNQVVPILLNEDKPAYCLLRWINLKSSANAELLLHYRVVERFPQNSPFLGHVWLFQRD